MSVISKNTFGFPREWFLSPTETCLCGFCSKVLNDPYQCKKGHMFCKSCIDASLADNLITRCPSCKLAQSLKYLERNVGAKRVIGDLKVRCPCSMNTSSHTDTESCSWTGKLNQLLERDCKFLYKCPDCKTRMDKSTFEEHSATCDQRLVTCDCGDEMTAKLLSTHKAKECVEEVVPCSLFAQGQCKFNGCAGSVPRKDIPSHQKASTAGAADPRKKQKPVADYSSYAVDVSAILPAGRDPAVDSSTLGKKRKHDGEEFGSWQPVDSANQEPQHTNRYYRPKADSNKTSRDEAANTTSTSTSKITPLTAAGGVPTMVRAVSPPPDFNESSLPGLHKADTDVHYQHGFNKKWFVDGGSYEGVWVRGMRWGYGVQTFPDGSVYGGRWVRDKRDGPGEMRVGPDGSCYSYVGDWKWAEKSGHGVETFEDGTRYTGNFLHDKADGVGVLLSPQLKYAYLGQFKDGKMHGNGLLYHFDGRVEKALFFQGDEVVEQLPCEGGGWFRVYKQWGEGTSELFEGEKRGGVEVVSEGVHKVEVVGSSEAERVSREWERSGMKDMC